MTEPYATAILLAVFGVLMAVSALMTRTVDRFGVPIVLLFLVLGMLGGSEGIGGLAFDNADLAFRIGTVALILILLDGGLNTKWASIKQAAAPAGLLATVGVVMTAGLVALAARAMGLDWTEAILIGAIVSSTDAAAVFSVLRGGGLRLKPRIQSTIEVESCANDPMAVILTLTAIEIASPNRGPDWWIALEVPLQLAIGLVVGVGIGFLFRYLMNRVRLSAVGLYPVVSLAAAFSAFGLATIVYGSGFLAVFAAGAVLGNGHLPYIVGLRRVHDALAWMSQVTMFITLGLLVFPSQLIPVAWVGIGLGLFLAIVARPLAVIACLSILRWKPREIGYVSWVGLRGAVPIVLATFPIIDGMKAGHNVFNIVFFIVVVSAIVPGASIVPITLKLGLGRRQTRRAESALELHVLNKYDRELRDYEIRDDSPVRGKTLAELGLPPGASIVLIVRNNEPLPARGMTRIEAEDRLYVVCDNGDLPAVETIIGT